MKYFTIFLTLCLLYACEVENTKKIEYASAGLSYKQVSEDKKSEHKNSEDNKLDEAYWFSGKAEVSKYELKQNRYREVHDGELILIFVTEDFLTDRQVKNDTYTNKNSVPILKTNQLRRFTTGLYDYSMMTSVFTRADGSGTEKITLSSQDWCGQSFVQINKGKGKKYNIQLRSYFESDGDQDLSIHADLLEDELLNLIRIDPTLIPLGEVEVLPSMVYSRLAHKSFSTKNAFISKAKKNSGRGNIEQLILDYKADQRKVYVSYEKERPHRIISIKEEYPSAFDQKVRTSEAVKVHELYDAYWKMNSANERAKRTELEITGFE